MGNTALNFRFDLIAFVVIAMASALWFHFLLKRELGQGFPKKAWALFSALLLTGIWQAHSAGERERDRLVKMVSGLAPTYANELKSNDLQSINEKTAKDDPTYLRLIEMQKKWLTLNPTVADIYTFGRSGDGKFVLLVDSETDYNHNGMIDGDREQRTPLGEVYEESDEALKAAFAGRRTFVSEPVSDRWGSWVSAYEPVLDEDGRVFAVVGVDYAAADWISAILATRLSVLGLSMVVVAILLTSKRGKMRLESEIHRRRVIEVEREQIFQQYLEASRSAGMAEVATGVLHNVGNALNSLNLSANSLATRLRESKLPKLALATAMIEKNQADLSRFLTSDERGRQLPEYLNKLAAHLAEEHKDVLVEISRVLGNVEHITQVVRNQQSYARGSNLATVSTASGLFEKAIDVSDIARQNDRIRIVRQFDAVPLIKIDTHKTLQILVNLLSNARQAIQEVRSDGGTIVAEIRHVHAEKNVAFCVTDNGSGIAPENMEKIFRHGFTTKHDGHGFGLHSAANFAAEMGGTLCANSSGPGHGSTFTLVVPITAAEETNREAA
jgi:signal transduction histidine kinase